MTPDNFMITIMNTSIFIEHLIDSLKTKEERLNARALSLALKHTLIKNLQTVGVDIDITDFIDEEKEYKRKKENWDHISKFYKNRAK